MNTIRFGIVGAGHIGLRHAQVVQSNTHAQLIAIADTDLSKETFVSEVGVPFYSSLETMLEAHPEIDVVNICTPNGIHASQANCALRFGKHVVCEKPMGLTKASCESVIFNALQAGRQVFCVMQNRYSPVSEWLKQTVQAGVLGTLYIVQINCYWNRGNTYYQPNGWKGTLQLDGGPLFTQFSHFIDLLYWLFGDIQHIQARFHNFAHRHNTQFEDSGSVHFQLTEQNDGALGIINYSTCAAHQNLESSMTILAENGCIKIGGQYMQHVEYCTIPNYPMPVLPPPPPPNNYGTYKGSASNHERVIQNVIDTLEGNAVATTNALEGMKVVEIIERIYQLRAANTL